MIFVDRAGNEYTFKMPVVFDVESPLRVVNEIASNTTVPQNGRVELVFNHAVQVSEEMMEVELVHGEEDLAMRLDDDRAIQVKGNRVLIFFDETVMHEGIFTLNIPAGAFKSSAGKENEAISMDLWISGICNTSYVVDGMRGEMCKCFSIGDRCQCSCGETHFSRAY